MHSVELICKSSVNGCLEKIVVVFIVHGHLISVSAAVKKSLDGHKTHSIEDVDGGRWRLFLKCADFTDVFEPPWCCEVISAPSKLAPQTCFAPWAFSMNQKNLKI